MIHWKDKVQDRHMEGMSSIGKVYVRLNREGKVDSMYTLFGTTEKYIPAEPWMLDLVGAQLELERLYEVELFSRKLASKQSV